MNRGFTLIELLVVISIISLLASIVFSGLQSARDEAKETAFIQELTQLQRAVELYRLQFGEAPNTNRNAGQIDSINNGSDTTSPLAQLVTNEYISTIGPDLSLAQESGSNGYPQGLVHK